MMLSWQAGKTANMLFQPAARAMLGISSGLSFRIRVLIEVETGSTFSAAEFQP